MATNQTNQTDIRAWYSNQRKQSRNRRIMRLALIGYAIALVVASLSR